MSAGKNPNNDQGDNNQRKSSPSLAEAWKQFYFKNEEAFAHAIDDYVAGQSFTDFLEQMGSQYLSTYKAYTNNMDRYFANNPGPSKKDIARIAELVVAVEEKIDNLDSDLGSQNRVIASSLIKLVDFQADLKQELSAIRQDIQTLQQLMVSQQARLDQLAAASPNPVESTQPASSAETKAPARPRTRSKKNDQQ